LALVGGLIAMGFSLALASTAFACTNLAELNVGPSAGQAGATVKITGSAFSHVPANTPVALHWGSANGPVLATITPDAAGAIGPTTITVPADATPGSYVIVASQTEVATGLTPWGTPARASFTVTGPASGAVPAPALANGGLNASTTSSSSGLIAVTIALGVGGLALFGLGVATFVGTMRRRAVPSKVRH
jgi:hypothetical protein